MDRDLTRGRTFPDNVARSIKAPLERTAPRYRERTSVIKESRVNVAAEVELTSRNDFCSKRRILTSNIDVHCIN